MSFRITSACSRKRSRWRRSRARRGNLCDRKEVTLGDQRSAIAKFYIFTSTHVAAKFAGVITDDFTSEFDPFSPQFGEKFSPPNMPIAFKDYTGNEISRVYSDQWGAFNGMTYSSWEVNPPNPTGYSPTMMVTCMNDPGPVPGPNGTMITDPLFNPDYSQFCYEIPFMPGQTQYMDTPVVPTAAFTGSGYNNVDCAYPDATPAIKEVDGDGVGPWVAQAGHTLTITALGDQLVNNYGYSGPSATTAPFNQKTVTRHYGFGANQGSGWVRIGGVLAPVQSWSDAQIVVQVPKGVRKCAVQQQDQYGGSTARCGELRIKAGNGEASIDAVTVTIGGKAPTVLTASDPLTASGPGAIQRAIDAAQPGDLIIVPPGNYNEMLIMWKPVRLQGVGAASSIINANTQPAGKLDPWRHEINCLFGLALDGTPMKPGHAYDATGAVKCAQEGAVPGITGFRGKTQNPQVDRLPLEGIIGWDTTTNGNLAQMLQEPTLMGAYEGAGITVLAKGVNTHGATGYYGSGAEAAFPTGTTVLTHADCTSGKDRKNPYPSNFQCNPSSIDGLAITDSSQGGGGIFVHAWAHNLQIANNRIYNNIGTLAGGINVGQGESPDGYFAGTPTDSDPGSCESSRITNTQLPYCFDMHLNVHNNYITLNQSIGDELFSGTPAGAGGVELLHRRGLLQVQLQLGLRQHEHRRRRRRLAPGVHLPWHDRAQLHPVQHELEPDHRDERRRAHHRGSGARRLHGGGPRVRQRRRHRLSSGPAGRHGSGAQDRCEPDHGQYRGERQRRRLALPVRERARGVGVPEESGSLVRGRRHEQHHREQRRGLGRRRRVPAGCARGESREQHDRLERHDRVLGRAVQHARRAARERTGRDEPDHLRDDLRAAARGTRDHAGQRQPERDVCQTQDHVPGPSRELHAVFQPVPDERRLLAEPHVLHRRRQPGCAIPAKHRLAVQLVHGNGALEPGGDGLLPHGLQLLGPRRAR